MKISTVEAVRMMWRWREWHISKWNPNYLTNGTVELHHSGYPFCWKPYSCGSEEVYCLRSRLLSSFHRAAIFPQARSQTQAQQSMRTTTPHQPAPPPHRINSERGVTDNLPQWSKKHRAHLLGANRRHIHIPLERLK